MAATQTVPQVPEPCNSSQTRHIYFRRRHGVVTLFRLRDRRERPSGSLPESTMAFGRARRRARFPRVDMVFGDSSTSDHDGSVLFAALRWLADQDATFVMLDRSGSVLATVARCVFRRADFDVPSPWRSIRISALEITRELICQMLWTKRGCSKQPTGSRVERK